MSDKPFRVLVVVDVQNCFMANTLGIRAGMLNQPHLEDCINMVKEIDELAGDRELVVFSRDLHPIGHSSFGEGFKKDGINPPITWPAHCRNIKSNCLNAPIESLKNIDRIDNRIGATIPISEKKISDLTDLTDPKLSELKDDIIYGPNLSYLFYLTGLKDAVKKINDRIIDEKTPLKEIGLTDSALPKPRMKPNIENINFTDVDKIDDKFVCVTKGQYCKYESYSAFNYHLPEVNLTQDYSTGLWEYILTVAKLAKKKYIHITVCGLVGNVCVIHSFLQGYAMWNKVYSKSNPDITVTLEYSFKGTLFAGVPITLADENKITHVGVGIDQTTPALSDVNPFAVGKDKQDKQANLDEFNNMLRNFIAPMYFAASTLPLEYKLETTDFNSVILERNQTTRYLIGGKSTFLCRICQKNSATFNAICKYCKKTKSKKSRKHKSRKKSRKHKSRKQESRKKSRKESPGKNKSH